LTLLIVAIRLLIKWVRHGRRHRSLEKENFMYVSSAISVVYPHTAYTGGANAAAPTTTDQDGIDRRNGDSVTISDEGRKAAYAEGVVPGVQTDAGTNTLEMYQVPSWRAEYSFELPGQLGVRGDWFAEKYPQAATASTAERAEYADLVQGHYQAVLEANGIQGVEAHYKATILDHDFSESLRQQMAERVRSDARLAELMPKLGKQLP
jgi:hypothetical protein